MTTVVKAVQYNKRIAPAEYDKGWVDTEVGNVQRAIPSTVVRYETASTTQQITDRTILMTITVAANVTLIDPKTAPLFPITVKNSAASTANVTVVATVDGVASPILIPSWSLTLQPSTDGTTWVIL